MVFTELFYFGKGVAVLKVLEGVKAESFESIGLDCFYFQKVWQS